MKIRIVVALVFSAALFGLPVEPQVAAGSVQMQQSGNTLHIETGDKTIINWQGFSIGSDESVHFTQPSSSSMVLNRVTGTESSQIQGMLCANGRFYLVNPNGVYLGSKAIIETAAFLASTLDILDGDFLFKDKLLFSGDSSAEIMHDGIIRASNGDVVFCAHTIEANGEITAENGDIALIKAKSFYIKPSGTDHLYIKTNEMPDGRRSHELAINYAGTAEAKAVHKEGGRIYLVADEGEVRVDGTLAAEGGHVRVLGDNVQLLYNAHIDVSAPLGGGEILIGGDYKGNNPDVPNAALTVVHEGATLCADATERGDGGRIIMWSDENTGFFGTATARGVDNGGFIECSGKQNLCYQGSVDLRASQGEVGTLLLDPKFIVINPVGTDPVANQTFGANPTGTQTISGADIVTALGSAAVVLQANTDITVDDNITSVSGNNLTLQAGRNITFNTGHVVDITGNFTAVINDVGADAGNRDAGTATFTLNSTSSILTNGADVSITTGTFGGSQLGVINSTAGTINAGGGNITLEAIAPAGASVRGIFMQSASSVSTSGTGTITMTGEAGVGGSNNVGVFLFSSSTVTSENGDITFVGTGATGAGVNNVGIALTSSQVTATGTGNINLTGVATSTGSNGSGVFIFGTGLAQTVDGTITIDGSASGSPASDRRGVFVDSGGRARVTGSGNLIIIGNSDGGVGACSGVRLSGSGSELSVVSGNLSVTGNGGTPSGASNRGVFIFNTAQVSSTGTGSITFNGTGGAGTSDNQGVLITGSADVTSLNGNIDITGIGGAGSSTGNNGIEIQASSTVTSTGTATITFDGTGGNSTSSSGVLITGAGALVSSAIGNIDITGVGGAGSSSTNDGIILSAAGQVTSTGAATITLNGTGTAGTDSNDGILITGTNSRVTSAGGLITMTGIGGGSGTNCTGINLDLAGQVTATNAAGITMIGTGSSSGTTGAHGIVIQNSASSLVTAVNGDISITGTGGSGTGVFGVLLDANSSVTATGTGDVTLASLTTGTVRDNGTVTTNSGNIIVNSLVGLDLLQNLTTTTGNIDINADTELFTNIVLTAGGAGTIDTQAIDGGGFNLEVNGGTGMVTLGSLTNTGTFTVTASGATTVTGTAAATTVNLAAKSALSDVIFGGAVTFTTVTTAATNYGVLFNGGGTVTNDTTFLNTGGVTFGGGATITFTGGLDTTAGTTTTNGTVNTTNTQMDIGSLTLAGATVLGTAGGTMNVGAVTGAANDLTVNGGALGAVSITSLTNIDDFVVTDSALTTVSGTTSAATVTLTDTTGAVTFNDNLTVTASMSAAANGFSVVLNGAVNSIAGNTILANTGGVTLGNASTDASTFIGGITSTASTTNIAGAVNTTTGAMIFGAIDLDANTTLTSSGNTMTLGAVGGDTFNLTVNGGAAGTVGIASLANITTLTITDSASTTVSGTTSVGTAVLTDTTGAISFNDNLTISTALTTAAQGYSVSMTGTTNSIAGNTTFLNTGGVTIGNGIGDTTTFTGGVTSTASTTNMAGAINTTSGNMVFGAANLDANTTLNSNGNTMTVGAVTGDTFNLTVDAGTNTVDITSLTNIGTFTVTNTAATTISGSTAATTVDLSGKAAGSNVTFGGAVTITTLTTAATNYGTIFNGGGTVTNDTTFLNTGGVTFGGGATITFTGGLDTTAGTTTTNGTVNTTNTQMDIGVLLLSGTSAFNSSGGAMNFTTTINNNEAFTANSGAGVLTFTGVVGGVTPLSTITATGSQINVNANMNAQGGTMLFNSPVVLTDDIVFTDTGGTGITFLDTITGTGATGFTLTITSAGTVTCGGAIDTQGTGGAGGFVNISSSAGNIVVSSITTSGTTVGGDITLQPDSGVTIGGLGPGTVVPDGTLRLNGDLTASGPIGGTINLSVAGRSSYPSVATIFGNPSGSNLTITGGVLQIGDNAANFGTECLTVFGDITFTIDGQASFGDIVAVDNLSVTATTIQRQLHDAEMILDSLGNLVETDNTHFLARAATPTFVGAVVDVGPGIEPDLAQITGFTRPELVSQLTFSGNVLNFDLRVAPIPLPSATGAQFTNALRTEAALFVSEFFFILDHYHNRLITLPVIIRSEDEFDSERGGRL